MEYSKLTSKDYAGRTYDDIMMEMVNLLKDIKLIVEMIQEKIFLDYPQGKKDIDK